MDMQLSHFVDIDAPLPEVWRVISDIEHSAAVISGIKSIEIITPAQGPGLLGLKWRETREWMGQDALEEMWITESEEQCYYQTRAESHGSVYTSRLDVEPINGGTRLSMGFHCQPVSLSARVIWLLTSWMANRSLSKVIKQDLQDIKHHLEAAA